ncbi:MAG TPA: hypothetical protein VLT35_07380, partial [Methanocella sp.]|nr:hypothetical protein [Methanocella sp.]
MTALAGEDKKRRSGPGAAAIGRRCAHHAFPARLHGFAVQFLSSSDLAVTIYPAGPRKIGNFIEKRKKL